MNPDQNDNDPKNASDKGQDPMPSSDQPMQQAMVGGPHKDKKKMWLWLLIILFVLLLLLFLGWWWMNKDKKDDTAQNNSNNNSQQQDQQPEDEVACDADFTAYENTDLGIGFCYPTDWGTVTVTDARLQQTATTVDGTVIAADTGERWLVSFSDKPAVHLGLVTADWSTEVGRDGTCVDPATPTLPAFSPFSTSWATEGTPVMYGTRGIEVMADQYLIQEYVDDLLTNGVCVEGYTIINGEVYSHTAASYSAEYDAPVTTPQQHIDDPNILIPEADRNQFYTFVKSVHKL